MDAILKDPGTWIALGVSALFLVAAAVMHHIFVKILKQSPPPDAPVKKKMENETPQP